MSQDETMDPPVGEFIELGEDEYAVVPAAGRHRQRAGLDPVGAVTSLGGGLVGRLSAGLRLVRETGRAGIDLALHRLPRAIETAPLVRVLPGLITGNVAEPTPERPPIAVRRAGCDVPMDAEALARQFPAATGRLVVFVSAPGESEACWSADVEEFGPGYGPRLSSLLEWSPVHLRLDDLDQGEAGLALAALLQRLVDLWPEHVDRLAVVAHRGAGLVVRNACGLVDDSHRAWATRLTDVVLLDSPMLVDRASVVSLPPARRLEEALVGITTGQPDLPPLDHVRYTAFLSELGSTTSPAGRLLGGLLWWRHRVLGGQRRARSLFPTAEILEVEPGVAPLTNNPEVQGALVLLLG